MENMRLSDYLDNQSITAAAFGRTIGLSEASMSRILAGRQVPRSAILARIAQATAGQVTPNDFHDIDVQPRKHSRRRAA